MKKKKRKNDVNSTRNMNSEDGSEVSNLKLLVIKYQNQNYQTRVA